MRRKNKIAFVILMEFSYIKLDKTYIRYIIINNLLPVAKDFKEILDKKKLFISFNFIINIEI